jgi:hypothetical protein
MGAQLVGSLREQVRQWKESDAFNAWPLDIQFLTKVLSDWIDQIERKPQAGIVFLTVRGVEREQAVLR